MAGKLIIGETEKGVTYANPLDAVKLFHEYMFRAKELELKTQQLEKKQKGPEGGIRVVLLNPVVDPLSRPGQPPRPPKLLGQDPSKPLPDATGTTTDAQPSPGPVPTHADGARKPQTPGRHPRPSHRRISG